jgi:magnesium chelatase family protein
MEDGVVAITRIAGSFSFPSKFMLIAAANPCPCGYLGDLKRECKCSPRMILKYQAKLSGPLLDRIDLHINVPSVDIDKLIASNSKLITKTSKKIREEVVKAREIQNKRFRGLKIYTNAGMKNSHIKDFCRIEKEALLLLKQAVNTYGLSARTYFRLIKVSQTIADLEGGERSRTISAAHVAEALQYRIRIND